MQEVEIEQIVAEVARPAAEKRATEEKKDAPDKRPFAERARSESQRREERTLRVDAD